MSKLSGPLKELIAVSYSRPGPTPAPKNIRSVFDKIQSEADARDVGLPSWLTLSTATTMTLNSPDSMLQLHELVASSSTKEQAVNAAELMREVGLKCISFNGIPRTINVLGAFYNGLPKDISSSLSKTPTRHIRADNVTAAQKRGLGLWRSVYLPFDEKLLDKLAQSHPNLPVHIIESHYAGLLSDPLPASEVPAKVGRILTSLTAIACLRSQTGVGPQVTSHIFGLRKAFEDGTAHQEGEPQDAGVKWLASDEGSTWVIGVVDRIAEAIGQGMGTSFAPGLKAKL